MRNFGGRIALALVVILAFTACSEQASWRRTLRKVGAEKFRSETLQVCRDKSVSGASQEVARANWPAPVRAFNPMAVWAEPDGAYVLIDSDAAGERGLYLPRILSETDPLCGPALKHVKLAAGVYWYERKR